ncbi:MAG: NAD(P)/FAD-dependent oxidoreductase [Saprospirales bacterium]|nr:MAG: NAD(P)/FAD-dependent oxidoreductase [Saprospirales bacterium]
MALQAKWDIGIIGGGLAGLSLAIVMAGEGLDVLVVEKEQYPRHKVCGEYVSNESLDFLKRLNFPFSNWDLPQIKKFELSFRDGNNHSCELDPGGFGISRYTLDHQLAKLAVEGGVELITGEKVTKQDSDSGGYILTTRQGRDYRCRVLIFAAGRNAGGVSPKVIKHKKANSWFGVKYHVDMEFPKDLIQINVFRDGYAGLSAVENNRLCFCYLAKSEVLKEHKGSIPEFEKAILGENPYLSSYLSNMQKISGPFTTGNFVFEYLAASSRSGLILGDSAGFIPPLTGNGMSLAFRSAAIAADLLTDHFKGKKSWKEVERSYERYGKQYLRKRIDSGIFLQNLAIHPSVYLQKSLSFGLNMFPFLLKRLSKKAVGKSF